MYDLTIQPHLGMRVHYCTPGGHCRDASVFRVLSSIDLGRDGRCDLVVDGPPSGPSRFAAAVPYSLTGGPETWHFEDSSCRKG